MRRLLALCATLAVSLPAGAASRLLVDGASDRPLSLRVDAAGAQVTAEGLATSRWALGPGTAVDSFVATGPGWLAAGTTPAIAGRELALWQAKAGERAPRSIPPPPGRSGAVRAFPVPLVRAGSLVGLAWLEGEASDRLGVSAASWDGRRWSAPVVVAPPGPGSQLGLTATVLADGSWLLSWSAFDGTDDEVVWSARRKGKWSPPRPADAGNEVPDVTPTLRADGDGALLAWSRYDGNDYRLVLARFTGGGFAAPTWAAGPGTLLPRWQGDALTFRDAVRGAWVAASVDAREGLHVEAITAAPAEPRPALTRVDGALRLLFP
jgi:hypothetical protein